MNIRIAGTAALIAATLPFCFAAPSMTLQTKMMDSSKMQSHKPMAGGVYVCKACKSYMSPAMAKKMGYKDAMGHKMMMMSKAPAGYKDGDKMGKMDKMGADKGKM